MCGTGGKPFGIQSLFRVAIPREKPKEAQDPKVIFGYALISIANKPDTPRQKVRQATQRVDDRTIGGVQTADGGFLLTGYTRGFGAQGLDLFLVRADATGQILWHQSYGGAGDDSGYAVIETADTSLLVIGETRSFGEGGRDLYTLKLNPDGRLE